MNISRPLQAIAFVLVLPTLFAGCKKDDDDDPAPAPSTPSQPVGVEDADALLSTSIGTDAGGSGTAIYSCVAIFQNAGHTQGVDVGSVLLNGVLLDSLGPGVYFSPSPSGLDFSSNATNWFVEGGNDFSTFTHTVNTIAFPAPFTMTSGGTVDKSAGYTLTTNTMSGADSVAFQIGLGAGSVRRTVAGNSTSRTFTAADLAGLTPGPSVFVSITAYRYTNSMIGGKQILFDKERMITAWVEVVD